MLGNHNKKRGERGEKRGKEEREKGRREEEGEREIRLILLNLNKYVVANNY